MISALDASRRAARAPLAARRDTRLTTLTLTAFRFVPMEAVLGAEPLLPAVGVEVRGRVGLLDLHAAHRVGREPAGAKAVAVAVQPVQERKHAEEDDVEERRVVPREVLG